MGVSQTSQLWAIRAFDATILESMNMPNDILCYLPVMYSSGDKGFSCSVQLTLKFQNFQNFILENYWRM